MVHTFVDYLEKDNKRKQIKWFSREGLPWKNNSIRSWTSQSNFRPLYLYTFLKYFFQPLLLPLIIFLFNQFNFRFLLSEAHYNFASYTLHRANCKSDLNGWISNLPSLFKESFHPTCQIKFTKHLSHTTNSYTTTEGIWSENFSI